jgi:hypothetical protein
MSSKKKDLKENLPGMSFPGTHGTMNWALGGTSQLANGLDPAVEKIEKQRQKDLESEIESLNWTMGKYKPSYGPDEFWDQRHTQARKGSYHFYKAVKQKQREDEFNAIKEDYPSSTYKDLPGWPPMTTLENPKRHVPDETEKMANIQSDKNEKDWLEHALKNMESEYGYSIKEAFCPWDNLAQRYKYSYYTSNDVNGLSNRKDWLELDEPVRSPAWGLGQVIMPKKHVPDDWELTQKLEYEKELEENEKRKQDMNSKERIKQIAKDEYLVEGVFLFKILENVTGVYQGSSVPLNKPIRSTDGPKKFHVYTKSKAGNVVKVNFGDPDMSIKRHRDDRRESFRARHNCDKVEKAGDKTTAGYWSCKMWQDEKSVSDMLGEQTNANEFVVGNKIVGPDGIERTVADHSSHRIVTQYAKEYMKKGKSINVAIKKTFENLHGHFVVFVNSGKDIIFIDSKKLEDALLEEIAQYAIESMNNLKDDKRYYALDFALNLYGQQKNAKFKKALKGRIIQMMGEDVFINEKRHPLKYSQSSATHSSVQIEKQIKEAQKVLITLLTSLENAGAKGLAKDVDWIMGMINKISKEIPSHIFEAVLNEKFKSKAQRDFFFAMSNKPGKEGEKWSKLFKEFEAETKDVSKLPDKVDEIFLSEKSVPKDKAKWDKAIAKAKEAYSVWPSAYASAAASKFYKEMGGTWKTVNEATQVWKNDYEDALSFLGIDLDDPRTRERAELFAQAVQGQNARKAAYDFYNTLEAIKESVKPGSSLHKWFNKENWVDISRTQENGSHPDCGASAGKGSRGSDGSRAYPVCRPKKEADKLTDAEKERLVRRKRREDNKPGDPDRVDMKP